MIRRKNSSILSRLSAIVALFVTTQAVATAADFEQTLARRGEKIGLTQAYNATSPQVWEYTPFTVYDQFFLTPTPPNALQDVYVTGTLKLDERARINQTGNWRLDITYTIKLYNASNTLVQTLSGENLSINYFKKSNYEDRAEKIYRNGTSNHKAVVEINQIKVTLLNDNGSTISESFRSNLNDAVFQDISLEWKSTSARHFRFDAQTAPTIKHFDANNTANPDNICVSNSPDNTVHVGWNVVQGAETYDLEWLFLDIPPTPGTNGAVIPPSITSNQAFDWRNATRVNLAGNFYEIPLLYPTGVIVYRVRAVGRDIDNSLARTEGKWSRVPVSSPYKDNLSALSAGRFVFCGLESSQNWTATISFAEEGKRKGVLSFVDGTGKTRQTVTTLNTDANTVVAESGLDHMGRPAVNFLPVAIRGEHYSYFHQFNSGFNAGTFDIESAYPETGNFSGIPGSVSTAAGRFYSSQNPFLTGASSSSPYDVYLARLVSRLPKAGAYPFSQSRFLNDGTGRPHSTSGVGDQHMLNGHDSKYLYGVPGSQAELDRLFGSEAGFVSNYKKNLVTDPNGQVSVSYVDGYGRTIATALAGTNTGNLLDRVSEPPAPITGDLLGNNTPFGNGTLIASKDITVAVDNTVYSFSYALTPAEYQTLCLGNYNCAYEFLIRVTDSEGRAVTPTGAPAGYGTDTWQDVSATTFPYVLNFSFPKGKYVITKTLRIREANYTEYRQSADNAIGSDYRNADDCFVAPYQSVSSACGDQCISAYRYTYINRLGREYPIYRNLTGAGPDYTDNSTLANLRDENGNPLFQKPANINALIDSAEAVITRCKNLCEAKPELNSGTECEMKRLLLLKDVLPDGQYFDNRPKDPAYTGVVNAAYRTGSESAPANRNAWLSAYASALLPDFNALLVSASGNTSWEYVRAHWNEIDETAPAFASLKEKLFLLHPEYCFWKSSCEGKDAPCVCKTRDSTLLSPSEYSNLMNAVRNDRTAADKFLFLPAGLPQAWLNGAWTTLNDFMPRDPLGNLIPVNPTTYCGGDPVLLDCGDGLTANGNIQDRLTQFMEVNVLPSGTRPISVWYILSDPENLRLHNLATGSHPVYPDGFVRYIQTLHGSPQQPQGVLAPFNTIPQAGQLSRWEFFRGIYTGMRKQMETRRAAIKAETCMGPVHPLRSALTACGNNQTPDGVSCGKLPYFSAWDYNDDGFIDNIGQAAVAGNGFSFKGMQIRYSHIPLLDGGSGTPGGSGAQTEEMEADYCENNCSALASQWVSQLQNGIRACVTAGTDSLNNRFTAPYIFTEELKYTLRNYFINICATSCSTQTASGIFSNNFMEADSVNWSGSLYTLGGIYQGQPIRTVQQAVKLFVQENALPASCPVLLNSTPGPGITPANPDSLSCVCNKLAEFIYESGGLKNGYGLVNPLKWQSVSSTAGTVFDFAALTGALAEIPYSTGGNTQQIVLHWLNQCANNPAGVITPVSISSVNYTFPDFFKCNQPENGFADLGELDGPQTDSAEAEAVNSLAFARFRDEQLGQFDAGYKSTCMELARTRESFTVSYTLNEYHYTLYYYDRAGNLVKTVPPAGVHPITDQTRLNRIAAFRTAHHHEADYAEQTGFDFPDHSNISNYVYNGQNQVIKQTAPDGGTTLFFYDGLGRMVLSQNARQATGLTASYTLFDKIGRVEEVGEFASSNMTDTRKLNQATVSLFPVNNSVRTPFEESVYTSRATKTQITRTLYDLAGLTGFGLPANAFEQKNLRGRVASSFYYAKYPTGDALAFYDNATHYSYDMHGNVNRLAQDLPALQNAQRRFLYTDYVYDLISDKVNEVHYMKGFAEQFSHYYRYDADNRITAAYSSKNGGLQRELEAKYFYYPTGPLARTELGRSQVQGLDYAYTLHGWLKGLNADETNTAADIGKDANFDSQNLHAQFGLDAAGFTLGYYQDDYAPIGTPQAFEAGTVFGSPLAKAMHPATDPGLPALTRWGLYNGNISKMVATGLDCEETPMPVLGRSFTYDQLNRITRSTSFLRNSNTDLQAAPASQTWGSTAASDKWAASYTYSPDGDLSLLKRTGDHGPMDDLEYRYKNNGLNTHRLDYVREVSGLSPGNYPNDLETQLPDNYGYDPIGNLVSDQSEQIALIGWNVYGKVKFVQRTAGSSKTNQWFGYNPAGQRIVKINRAIDPANPGAGYQASFYALDAQGNILSLYEYKPNKQSTGYELFCADQMIYGTSRIGMLHRNLKIGENCVTLSATENSVNKSVTAVQYVAPVAETLIPYQKTALGNREYEVANHLGNVLATVADRKLIHANDVQGPQVARYRPQVLSSGDYYPFGMKLPGRGCTQPVACVTTSVITEEWVFLQDVFQHITPFSATGTVVTPQTCGGQPCVEVATGSTKDGAFFQFALGTGLHEAKFDLETIARTDSAQVRMALFGYDSKTSAYTELLTEFLSPANGPQTLSFNALSPRNYRIQLSQVGTGTTRVRWRNFGVRVIREVLTTDCESGQQPVNVELVNENFETPCSYTFQEDFSAVVTTAMQEDFAVTCSTTVPLENFNNNCVSSVFEDFTYGCSTTIATHTFDASYDASMYFSYGSGGSLSINAGRLQFTGGSGLRINVPTTIGETYTLSFAYTTTGSNITATTLRATPGTQNTLTLSGSGTHFYTFKATATTTQILIQYDGTGTKTALIDNFSMCRNTKDYSPFRTSGTVNQLLYQYGNAYFSVPATGNGALRMMVDAVTGQTYTVKFAFSTSGPGANLSGGSHTLFLPASATSAEYTFTATTTGLVPIILQPTGAGNTSIDNYSVCKNAQDYSKFSATGNLNSLSFSNNNLTFSSQGTGNSLKITLPTVANQTYTASFDYTRISPGITAYIGTTPGYATVLTDNGNVQTTFKATGATTDINVILTGGTGIVSAAIDNFAVCQSNRDLSPYKPFGSVKDLRFTGGKLSLTTAAASGTGLSVMLAPTEVGQSYTVTFDYTRGTPAGITSAGLQAQVPGAPVLSLTADGAVTYTFTAQSLQTELRLLLTGTSADKTISIDNLVLNKVPANYGRFTSTNVPATPVTFTGGKLNFSTATSGTGVRMSLPTAVGKTYTLSLDYVLSGAATSATVQAAGGTALTVSTLTGSSAYVFTASATSTDVTFVLGGGSGTKTATLDNVALCQRPEQYDKFVPLPTPATANLAFANGKMTINANAAGEGMKTVIETVPGEVYRLSFDYLKLTSGVTGTLVTANGITLRTVNTDGTVNINYTATSTQTVLTIIPQGTGYRGVSIDNFKVTYDAQYSLGSGGYAFGFNGQEKDNEIYGEGNSYTAEFWLYDPRIARRWNVDPMFEAKPWMTPYHAFSNKPILNIDPDGAFDTKYKDEDGNLLGETNDGRDVSVTIKNEYKDAFRKEYENILTKDLVGQNNYWTSTYSKEGQSPSFMNSYANMSQPTGSGNTLKPGENPVLTAASNTVGLLGLAADEIKNIKGTFRITSGATNGLKISPKYYASGWQGGSRARITTYSFSKIGNKVSNTTSVIATGYSYYQIYDGSAQPITYLDAGVGTVGLGATGVSYFYGVEIPGIGEAVALYGTSRLAWDIFFPLGQKYGPCITIIKAINE